MAREPNEIIPLTGELQLTEEQIARALEALASGKRRKADRFVLAALSSIPWVGGLLAGAAALDSEAQQGKVNQLHRDWLEEHKRRLGELAEDLAEIMKRVDQIGPAAEQRLESDEYLNVVRKAFRIWDSADTREKRDYARRLLSNAAGTTLCSDDVVRLFLEWIDYYHEVHFAVIRVLYKQPMSTRWGIWQHLHGGQVREDSADADLFSLVVSDLSLGRVIRQHRETTVDGTFLKKPRTHVPKGYAARTMKSRLDDTDEYELTELGSQFVHYVMTDVVPRIGGGPGEGTGG
jgi:hypothetical protein